MRQTARHWYFNKRPKDVIEDDTLVLREEPLPELKDGEFLFRPIYLSLDATNRVWMSDWDTYMDPASRKRATPSSSPRRPAPSARWSDRSPKFMVAGSSASPARAKNAAG